jgi:hypothetical protein
VTLAVSRNWMQRYHAKHGNGQARAKYGNKKVKGFDADGATITFDSKREAKRWGELVALQKAGKIKSLERQVPFTFSGMTYKSNRKVKYVLDFQFFDCERKEWVHEDCKGFSTPDYKLKWALMKHFWKIEVRET